MALGIDFGTTRTVVACGDRGNYPVTSFINDAGDAVEWFPSVVAEKDGELRYGFEAQSSDASWTKVRSFKRLLAGSEALPDATVEVGTTPVPVVELLADYLRALRRALVERSNLPHPVDLDERIAAVVGVPANSPCTQRFLTLEAFRRAGFAVAALINEPSAAGFEYTHRFRTSLTSRRDHIVVYDLGGGTFDASLVRMRGRHHEVVASRGINRLGGDDFDFVLASLVQSQAGLNSLGPQARARLNDRCRLAKEALTPQTRKLIIDLEHIAASAGQTAIEAASYYRACGPLVEQSIEAMRPVMLKLDAEEPLAGSERDDIAGIYVVGGASMLPVVGRLLRERFGRRVHRSAYPFAATAIGLAIAADPESGFQLKDRFARSFGVFREAQGGRAVAFDPIVTPETELPSDDAPLRLTRTYRAAHNLGHFRFVECALVDAKGMPRGDIVPFCEALVAFDPELRKTDIDLCKVPVCRTDDGPLIEEEYTIDTSGLVEVCVRDVSTGYEKAFRIGTDLPGAVGPNR